MRKTFEIGFRGCAIVLGLVLMGTGGVHFLASVQDLPGNRTLRAIHGGETVSNDVIDEALVSRRSAQTWVVDPKRGLDIAVLLLERSKLEAPGSSHLLSNLESAKTELVETLRLLPIDAYAWTNLTIVETNLSASLERVDTLFEMSMLGAPVEERLAPWRIAFGLSNREWLSEQNQNLVRRQIRILALLKPEILIKIVTHLRLNAEIATYLSSIGGFEEISEQLTRAQ